MCLMAWYQIPIRENVQSAYSMVIPAAGHVAAQLLYGVLFPAI